MNEKGEVQLLLVFFIAALSGVLLLCGMRLQKSFSLMEKRTELFLCVKETEGELRRFMKFMGRTNWAIKNVKRAKLIMVFIPGLQGGALQAEKAERTLILLQNTSLVPYLKKVRELQKKSCPLPVDLIKTPFALSGAGFSRNSDSTAALRRKKWTNYYVEFPFTIAVEWDAGGMDSLYPRLKRTSSETAARLSSILSFY